MENELYIYWYGNASRAFLDITNDCELVNKVKAKNWNVVRSPFSSVEETVKHAKAVFEVSHPGWFVYHYFDYMDDIGIISLDMISPEYEASIE